MVALPPVPGCLKHQFFNTVGSDTNVSWHLFWDAGAAPTQAQASAAADAAHNAWIAHLAPLIGTTMSLTQVKVTDLSDPAGPVGINGTAAAGTRTGSAPLSAPVSVLVNGTFLTAFETGWDSFIGVLGSSMNWAVPSAASINIAYFKGHHWTGTDETGHKKIPDPYPGGPHKDAIIAWKPNPLIGTQRRRVRPG